MSKNFKTVFNKLLKASGNGNRISYGIKINMEYY